MNKSFPRYNCARPANKKLKYSNSAVPTDCLINVGTLKRLGPEINSRPPRWEACTLEKSHSKSLLLAIRNICILSRDQGEFSRQ